MPWPRRRRGTSGAVPRMCSGIRSTMSQIWWAMESTAARATCPRVLAMVRPEISACASRSQCGAPRPEKAGTRVTPELSTTDSAWVTSSATEPWASNSAVQASVAPEDKMFPSSAYVGVSPRSQARVAETSAACSGTGYPTGVITDEPVRRWPWPVPTPVQPCPYSAAWESASTARRGV